MHACICIVVSIELYSQLSRKHTEAHEHCNKILPKGKNKFPSKILKNSHFHLLAEGLSIHTIFLVPTCIY